MYFVDFMVYVYVYVSVYVLPVHCSLTNPYTRAIYTILPVVNASDEIKLEA